MERALNLSALTSAVGSHERLADPSEVQDLLLRAELNLFTGREEFDGDLLHVGWYLHALALSDPRSQVPPLRRLEAARVSAHIFDVYLQHDGDALDEATFRRYALAAQAGYMIGDIAPNSVAVGARSKFAEPSIDDESPGLLSLHAAALLLSLAFRDLGRFVDITTQATATTIETWGVETSQSPFASAANVLSGISALSDYLLFGEQELLARATQFFLNAIQTPFADDDTDSRWVAAMLIELGEYFGQASLWALLPGAPSVVAAFTQSEPSVAVLWPPQAEFVAQTPSPFDTAVRRQVLSFPTSAGKTLLAQLIICDHLARHDGKVFIVAPTHSLCRELKDSLDPRLEHLGTWAHDAGSSVNLGPKAAGARVVVATPERFSAALRADPAALLAEFSMFVIDEAHLLAEENRGWGLEEALSLLHDLTLGTDHRLVVISAALGNLAHVTSWLATSDEPLSHQSEWRGPRRLQAVYSPSVRWTEKEIEPKHGSRQERERMPIDATVHLRKPDRKMLHGSFGDAGTFVRAYSPKHGTFKRSAPECTTQNQQLLPMVNHLVTGAGAPCLVVVASRRDAKELATLVADDLDVLPENAGLVDLLRSHLPPSHILPDLAAKGVAFHHGVLPREVQAELEAAARRRQLRCVVATTTLTEGINLPFRSVVIGRTGYGSGAERQEVVDPARLLNAFGRAGRACRETEGWLFFSWFGNDWAEQFEVFDKTGADLELVSTLNVEQALASLDAFESLMAGGVDAVLADNGLAVNGFLTFVWLLADVLGQLRPGGDLDSEVLQSLERTLAWQQFDQETRDRWAAAALAGVREYTSTPIARRRKWSRTGTSLATSAALQDLTNEVVDRVENAEAPASVAEWLNLVLADGTLERLLNLPENQRFRGIRPRPNVSLDQAVDADFLGMLSRWVAGDNLDTISSDYLSVIEDDDYRADALAEFVAAVFEHFLPWVLRTLIAWANEMLHPDLQIPKQLPEHIHYGVGTSEALELMGNGVRSRRLAVAVADILAGSTPDELRSRIAQLTLDDWRSEFGATPTELQDLLAYVHDPSIRAVSEVLEGQEVRFSFHPEADEEDLWPGPVEVALSTSEAEPKPYLLHRDGLLIGTLDSTAHTHVTSLLGLGIALRFELPDDAPHLVAVFTA